MELLVGIDEAGRGPLAGPVFAGAVILDPAKPIKGLNDSKKLSSKQREKLFEEIKINALHWAFGVSEADEIDKVNILQATFLAMQRAVTNLTVTPTIALIDGNQAPKLINCKIKMIINGDALEPAISAASIVAKVLRDQEMLRLDQLYPQYGFAKHKGYGTAAHIAAIKQFGPCEIHRRSFAPVRPDYAY